ncbi:MAG: AI-2E family transporter [Thermaerobacter sp.]|nr:AI-2E family transporter [Thermaerobacter sp.]MDA8144974.1 AI-2E family transporter [Thermaerobacter sp.]
MGTWRGPGWGRMGILGGLTLLVLLLIWRVRAVLTPFFFAALVAYLLHPGVTYLERRGLPRGWAVLVLYLAGALGLVGAGLFLLPPLAEEANRLGQNLPGYLRALEAGLTRWEHGYSRLPLPPLLRSALDEFRRGMERRLLAGLRGGAHHVLGLFPGLVSLVISPLLAYYLLRDAPLIREHFLKALPTAWRCEVQELLGRIDRVLTDFIWGQLRVAAVVGVLAAAAAYLLGVRYALLLGAVAGVTDLIPYFGPLIGAVPAVLLGLLRSPTTAFWIALCFLAIHELEGSVIAPNIVGESVGLHPLVVILALLAGVELGGLWGMLLAVPTAGVIKILAQYLHGRLAAPPAAHR